MDRVLSPLFFKRFPEAADYRNMTLDEMIDDVAAEYVVEPRDILRALLAGLARTHLLDEDAHPDFAVSEEKTGGSGAVREVLALQHWNSKRVWEFGQTMPPFDSLLETLVMAMQHESIVSDEAAEHVADWYEGTPEEAEALADLNDLSLCQGAARALLEEAMCEMEERRYAAGKPLHQGSIPFPNQNTPGERDD